MPISLSPNRAAWESVRAGKGMHWLLLHSRPAPWIDQTASEEGSARWRLCYLCFKLAFVPEDQAGREAGAIHE
jgi:hypothetical protein